MTGLFGLLKLTRVLLTNDTGPMHIAYALGTPLVAVFGSTSSELTGPLGANSVVLRQPVEDLAGTGRADPGSLREALRLAIELSTAHRP